ncbi:MAG: RsmD family RNA methyltransferase, partial [Bacteroidales bacterium]|nr:RsmD family RNA methyltransferase [Candidatus Hennigimonas equi]
MRIIGGRLRGRSIEPPRGYKARPTTDFAKEGLFNILGNEYEFDDLAVLDLFGGTGSIGIEFAARGASLVDTVEMSPDNAAFIRRSAASLS